MRIGLLVAVAVLGLMLVSSAAADDGASIVKAAPPSDGWVVSLDGTWQFTAPDTKEALPIAVPGFWVKLEEGKRGAEFPSGVYRRTFTIESPSDAKVPPGAVLEFESIRWGGEVFVNGKSVGRYDLAYSPCSFDISEFVKVGENVLEVIPRGWASLEKYEGGDVKLLSGSANWFGSRQGGIIGDVSLRLYRGARVASIAVHTKVKGPSCGLTVSLAAGAAPWEGKLVAQVLSDDGLTAMSAPVGQHVQLKAGQSLDVELKDIQIPDGKLWWPQSPTMYRVSAWLEASDSSKASVREESFGLREVSSKDGRLQINGRSVALHGYTGVAGYSKFDMMADEQALFDYQIKAPGSINARAFRGHMNPLVRKWIDLCDRNGMLIICEMPNFPDIQRQPSGTHEGPYARPDFVERLKREVKGIITLRANHPSIVAWSASNEGNGYGDWERANLVPFVKSIDPTRLVMLSADITPDFADSHNFAGNWYGTQADFERNAANLAKAYPDRIVGCSEYGQFMDNANSVKRFGRKTPSNSPVVMQAQALLISEQTEALRRCRFGLIMPFGDPAPWRKKGWDVKDASDALHAQRNALASLAVSLNFPLRHAQAGAAMDVPVWVMSDDDAAKGDVKVDVYLLDKYPGFAWDGNTDGTKVLFHDSFQASVESWQAVQKTVAMKVPASSGDFTLAAVLICPGQPTAISLRPLKVFEPLPTPTKKLVVGVIEKDGKLAKWLTARGHKVVLPYGDEIPNVIVVAEGLLNDSRLGQYGFELTNRIFNSGVRMVFLEQQAWNGGGVYPGVLTGLTTTAEAEPTENAFADDAMAKVLGDYNDFIRPNGYEGVSLRVRLELPAAAGEQSRPTGTGLPVPASEPTTPSTLPASGPAAASPSVWTPLILAYTRNENRPDWALVRKRYGAGEIVACQIPITERLDSSRPSDFDPVVERLFASLIEDVLP